MTEGARGIASLVISCAAFLVSGLALGWTIYRDLLDKGRLKVDLMVGLLVADHPGRGPVFVSPDLHAEMVKANEIPPATGQCQMVATITNVGRRPILASKLAGRTCAKHGRKEWFVFKPRALPKALQPGDFTMEWSEDSSVFSEDLRGFYVFDSAGHRWSAKRRAIRKYNADVKRFVVKGEKR